MKKVLLGMTITVVVVFLLVICYIGYHKLIYKASDINAFSAVPSDAAFVVETENLSKAWSTLSGSSFWQYLKSTEYFADINSDLETVDWFLNNNKAVDKILSNRKLLVVGCMPNARNWDLVYLIDLKEFSKYFAEIKASLKLVNGFKLLESKVTDNEQTYEILTLRNIEDPTFDINISLINNILAISLDKSLVERVIHHHNTQFWDNNLNFKVVSAGLSNRKMFKAYINYKLVPGLYSIYSTENSDIMDMLGVSLAYTAAELNFSSDQIYLDGYTSLDSVYSYIRAFSNVAPGKTRCAEIMSNQTAVYLSLNFSSFMRFYTALMDEYAKGNPKEVKSMESDIKIVEKYLGFSLKDDFLGWIGTEIAICKLRPLSEKSRDVDGVVFVNAADIKHAKESLGKIVTHVNRRTPVSFKIEPYRNFDIQYLGVKGIFKMFLGKLFANIEKPFFTYIEDYVVFANSQESLHQIIDDYLQGRTLMKNYKFADFKDPFDVKTNVSMFVQTPKMYETLYKYAPAEDKKSLAENKNLICSFSHVGFQLVNDAGIFRTLFAIQYDSTAASVDSLQVIESLTENSIELKDIDSLEFKAILPTDTVYADGAAKVNYDSSLVIHFEGNVESNRPEGIWRTYYPSGNLYVTANYHKGKLDGIAYFYHDNAKQVKMAEVEFDSDRIDGTYTEFFTNGKVKARIMYQNGIKEGETIFFYENGTPKLQCKYKKGRRNGKSTIYDKNGKKLGKLDVDTY